MLQAAKALGACLVVGRKLTGQEGISTVCARGHAQEAEIGERTGVTEGAPMVLADVV